MNCAQLIAPDTSLPAMAGWAQRQTGEGDGNGGDAETLRDENGEGRTMPIRPQTSCSTRLSQPSQSRAGASCTWSAGRRSRRPSQSACGAEALSGPHGVARTPEAIDTEWHAAEAQAPLPRAGDASSTGCDS